MRSIKTLAASIIGACMVTTASAYAGDGTYTRAAKAMGACTDAVGNSPDGQAAIRFLSTFPDQDFANDTIVRIASALRARDAACMEEFVRALSSGSNLNAWCPRLTAAMILSGSAIQVKGVDC